MLQLPPTQTRLRSKFEAVSGLGDDLISLASAWECKSINLLKRVDLITTEVITDFIIFHKNSRILCIEQNFNI